MTTTTIDGYFDYAATAPMLPEAITSYADTAREQIGNPSAAHALGQQARQVLEDARRRISRAVAFDDGRLVFTSGGSESNNLVIRGWLAKHRQGRVLIATDVHPSIWFATERFRDRIDVLPLPGAAPIDARHLVEHLHADTALVCLSHACNETGQVHGVEQIAHVCQARSIGLLVDGTQAMGHLPVDLSNLVADWYTFSAHKFGGPRGCGGVFLREASLEAQISGGPQEWQLRAGTESVAAAVATATALEISCARIVAEADRLRSLTRRCWEGLVAACPAAVCNSDLDEGLPGLLSVSVADLPAHEAVVELGTRGFALATGSACHADQVHPSRTILALGRTPETALGTLRISMGYATTAAAVDELTRQLVDVVGAMCPAGARKGTS